MHHVQPKFQPSTLRLFKVKMITDHNHGTNENGEQVNVYFAERRESFQGLD